MSRQPDPHESEEPVVGEGRVDLRIRRDQAEVDTPGHQEEAADDPAADAGRRSHGSSLGRGRPTLRRVARPEDDGTTVTVRASPAAMGGVSP